VSPVFVAHKTLLLDLQSKKSSKPVDATSLIVRCQSNDSRAPVVSSKIALERRFLKRREIEFLSRRIVVCRNSMRSDAVFVDVWLTGCCRVGAAKYFEWRHG
jgi:hypothetical protein